MNDEVVLRSQWRVTEDDIERVAEAIHWALESHARSTNMGKYEWLTTETKERNRAAAIAAIRIMGPRVRLDPAK